MPRLVLVLIFSLLVLPSAFAQLGGNEAVAGKSSQDGFTVIDLMNPITGVEFGRSHIRGFQLYSSTGCTVTLKIFRETAFTYQLVGSSAPVTLFPGDTTVTPVELEVREGDLVGYSTLDIGSGAVDYDDSDATLTASVAYRGDVGTVEKENGSVLPYVRAIKVLGVPSAETPATFRGISYVPVVARAVGTNGTLFRTAGRLFNPSTGASTYSMTFVPSGDDGSTDSIQITDMSLAAGETHLIEDVLLEVFGLNAGTGLLRITSAFPFHSQWRIVNETDAGPFGQDIPAIGVEEGLKHDETAPNPESVAFFLLGAEESDEFRTNFGASNLSSADSLEFTLQPFDEAGTALADARAFEVPPFSHQQWNRVLTSEFGLAPGVTNVRLVVKPKSTSNQAQLFAYLSIINNRTEDPVFVRGGKANPYRSF